MAKKKARKSDEDNKEGKGGKGGKKKKKILILVGLALVGGVAYKFVLAPGGGGDEMAESPEVTMLADVEEGDVVALPELVINLADERERYLRVTVAVVLEKGASATEFEAELARASDVAIDYLSSKTFDDLRSETAKAEAKVELAEKMREAFDGEMVARVLFSSFVMQ